MSRTVRIIGIPIDLGQQHRGVDMGPVALRYAGLSSTLKRLGYQTHDIGNIEVPGHYTLTDSSKLHSLDIMETNPILDIINRTAEVAVSLIASLFGKSIL